MSTFLLLSLLLPAQTGTLDQQSPFGNAWFNGGASTLTWQSEVATGVAGTLEGFDLRISSSVPGNTLDVSVRVGAGWNTGTVAWTGTLTTTVGGSAWENHFVDVSSANIALNAGDLWVIEMHGSSNDMGIQGQYNAPPATPPYPEELYLNGPGCFADCGWRIGFNTYMLTGPSGPQLAKSGSCPGPVTLSITGATPNGSVALVHGPAGSWTKPGGTCAGVTLAMNPPTLGGFVSMNGTGAGALSFTAPAGACGLTVQGVDIATCTPTNAITL